MEWIQSIIEAGANVLAASTALLIVLIALFELIPGSEPERTLKKVLAWIERHSKK